MLDMYLGNDYRFIWNDRMCSNNGKRWFVGGNIQALFALDETCNEVTECYFLPTKLQQHRGYILGTVYKNNAICIPRNSSNIQCFDICNKEWATIEILDSHEDVRAFPLFVDNTLFYFVSWEYGTFFTFDMEKKKVTNTYKVSDSIKTMSVINNRVYYLLQDNQRIEVFDIASWTVTDAWTIPLLDDSIVTMCVYKEKYIWMSGYKKGFYRYDVENGTMEFISKGLEIIGEYNLTGQNDVWIDCNSERFKRPLCSRIIAKNEELWVIPYSADSIIRFDSNMETVIVFNAPEENINEEVWKNGYIILDNRFQDVYEDEDHIELFSNINKDVLVIDVKSKTYSYKNYSISRNVLRSIVEKMNTANGSVVIGEAKDYNLEDFFAYISK